MLFACTFFCGIELGWAFGVGVCVDGVDRVEGGKGKLCNGKMENTILSATCFHSLGLSTDL